MHIKKIVGISLAVVVGFVVVIGLIVAIGLSDNDPFLASYDANCASCHGFDLEGTIEHLHRAVLVLVEKGWR